MESTWCRPAGLVLLAALVAGCSSNNLFTRAGAAPSPHERYSESLRKANLGDTALGRDWIHAGQRALAHPLLVQLPLNETGYFPAETPLALAYRFTLERGRRLSVELSFDGLELPRLFADLFAVRADAGTERVASLVDGTTLTYDVARDGDYVLRIQPELLRSGRFSVVERTLASLPFPVSGLTAAAVQSEFGAARDAGRRQHQGIDIFAPRLTPVLAVADGTARTGTNGLGGKVVWLRGGVFGASFYYAHLEEWAFAGTARVRAGDVVGYVGNSGNAHTTSPHLHFGIYDGGAIDPLPFIRGDDPVPPPAPGAAQWLAETIRVTSPRTALRAGRHPTATAIAELRRATVARVLALSGSAVRLTLPDGSQGYVDRRAVAVASTPLRRQQLAAGTSLRERPLAQAPIHTVIDQTVTADVVGEFNGFALVQAPALRPGWLVATAPTRGS
jgi:peptidoglycan LD-endopeptidase LytH